MLKAISLIDPLIMKCLAHYNFFLTAFSKDPQKGVAKPFSINFVLEWRFFSCCLFVIGLTAGASQL